MVSVTAAVEIALPTGELLRARGVFEIVKLRLGNLTRQPRLIGPAVTHLEVGGALIAPSTPVGAALVGSGWRPLRLQSLSAGHSAVRKLFYDVAPGARGRPLALRVGHGDGAAGDHHVLILQSTNCRLYEMFDASPNLDGSWNAASGATFDLRSNALRPDGFTSADAAGLAILPGLVRYDEIQAGVIDHAIRFTVAHTQRGYVHPATHFASSDTDPSLPPMGLRLRLKAGFDVTGYPRTDQIILTAMKRYGLIVADNGANWFFQGPPDRRWSDDELNALKQVPGSAFEAVHTGPILGGT